MGRHEETVMSSHEEVVAGGGLKLYKASTTQKLKLFSVHPIVRDFHTKKLERLFCAVLSMKTDLEITFHWVVMNVFIVLFMLKMRGKKKHMNFRA